MKEKIKSIFLYAGLERAEYEAVKPREREVNRSNLLIYSLVGAAAFLVLLLISLFGTGFYNINAICYAIGTGVMFVLLALLHFVVPKHEKLTMPLVYVFEYTLLIFGVVVSLLHAELPAVSAMAFLLVTPLLFYDRPISILVTTALIAAPFCILVKVFKTPEIASVDIWNMLSFGFVAIAVNIILMRVKLRGLAQERRVMILSETDLLTGLKNRNCYELRLPNYMSRCRDGLVCVFLDVNGLHELNNREGHQAGDRLLQTTAKAVQDNFGMDHSYRVGGDEFVAFAPDHRLKEVEETVARMCKALEAENYHVSCGVVYGEKKGGTDATMLVQEAEQKMFAVKKAYYERLENNRRTR